MAQEADPKVRHEFVGMMFAVAIGEVGVQTAALAHYEHYIGFLPVYLHLLLATIIIASSWVGWTLTPTREAQKDLTGVLRKQFFVLLLDVLLVVLYFILVRAMSTTAGDSESPRYTFAAEADARWLVWIFVCYLLWDCLTKIPTLLGHKKDAADPEIADAPAHTTDSDEVNSAAWRMLISVGCLVASVVVYFLVRDTDPVHVCWSELALIALVLTFRALKELATAKWPPSDWSEEDRNSVKKTKGKALGWSIVFAISVALFAYLACRISVPCGVANEIRTAVGLFGPVNLPGK